MKRNGPRLSLTKRGFFAQQFSVVFYNANFTERRFSGFLKKYFTFWGQKIFVVKWNKILKPFFQRYLFGSKRDWALHFLSQGLAWGTSFKKKMSLYLAYFIYDQVIKVSKKFSVYFSDLKKVGYIFLSNIHCKLKKSY